jgi:hypothetical protein
MKSSPARVVGVTAALLVCGAVLGALAAVLGAWLTFRLTVTPLYSLPACIVAAGTGAVLGGALFPAAYWLLLRRVPLGLALPGTLLGTVAGGVAGGVFAWRLGYDTTLVVTPVGGAVLGFVLAAILLRLRFSAPRAAGDRPIARPAGL